MITFTKINEIDEIPNHLGFMERKVFQIIGLKDQTNKEILSEILDSEIFFINQKYRNYERVKPEFYQLRTNHAFSDKIEITDFEHLTFSEYQSRIDEIIKDPDWGEDLPIFNQLINRSKNWIIENGYQNEQVYFINSESMTNEKLIEYNYYSYFMTTIIISNSKVIIFNHGGD